jgi:hypothetical protein
MLDTAGLDSSSYNKIKNGDLLDLSSELKKKASGYKGDLLN